MTWASRPERGCAAASARLEAAGCPEQVVGSGHRTSTGSTVRRLEMNHARIDRRLRAPGEPMACEGAAIVIGSPRRASTSHDPSRS